MGEKADVYKKSGATGCARVALFCGSCFGGSRSEWTHPKFWWAGGGTAMLREDGGDVISSSCCRKTVNDVKLGESEKKGSNFLIRG